MTRNLPERKGLLSLASVFVLFMLLILLGTIWNASRMSHRKLEAQNAADAIAQASGVQMSRSMNMVTAINHLIGELNALDTLAYSYGGMELEEKRPFDLAKGIQPELESAYRSARIWGLVANGSPKDSTWRKLRVTSSESGAAIGHSRRRLKEVLSDTYRLHAAAAVMVAEPELSDTTHQMGKQLLQGCLATESLIEAEWDILQSLEITAKNVLLPLKWLCNHTLIPALYQHCKRVVEGTPERAEAVARDVGTLHNTQGTLFPNTRQGIRFLELPLIPENEIVRGNWEESQMVRATTPWVQYWRIPVLEFGEKYLVISQFEKHYRHFTNDFTLKLSRWAGADYGTYLYVLKDTDYRAGDKGLQPWTFAEGSRRADEIFGLLGIAHQQSPATMGRPIFPETQPDGMAAYAQGMLYNANPQEPLKQFADRQPTQNFQRVVGWDTLNWSPEVPIPEFRNGLKKGNDAKLKQPEIRVNWRVKLVPVTLSNDAKNSQEAPLNRILDRGPITGWMRNSH